MAKLIGSTLPDELLQGLSGHDLETVASSVIMLFTVDPDGWPHPAMLSYFEVVAHDARNIRLATYATSATTANMRRSGFVTLMIVRDRIAYYIKGRAEELQASMRSMPHNAKLNCRVEHVLVDQVDEQFEPGAYIAGGITYVNPGRDAELERARPLLAELLA